MEVRTTLSTPYPFELLNHGRQHVFRDLHPYCCTFEDCATADRLYDSRHAWFKHELEAHRAIWQCFDGCEKAFAAEKDFVAHVAKIHPEMASDDVLSVLKRTAVKSANLTKPSQCPLCDKVMSLCALQKHLGNHQEQLALFALPPNIDATEDGEEDSNYAENHGEPNESLSSDISEGETLDDNGGHSQGLRQFPKSELEGLESDDDFSSVPISTPNDEELLDPREGSSSVPDDAVPDSGATISFVDLPTFSHIAPACRTALKTSGSIPSFYLEKPSSSIAAKMPAPVSIGDAFLTKLALKIGQAFTKGRKSAPAEFREVESQLYSLSAALYALRVARESGISPPLLVDFSNLPRNIPSHYNDNQDIILGMLGSCKDTLSHLESIVEKYSIIRTSADPEQPRLKRWSRELKANWKKIAWTTERWRSDYAQKQPNHPD